MKCIGFDNQEIEMIKRKQINYVEVSKVNYVSYYGVFAKVHIIIFKNI